MEIIRYMSKSMLKRFWEGGLDLDYLMEHSEIEKLEGAFNSFKNFNVPIKIIIPDQKDNDDKNKTK